MKVNMMVLNETNENEFFKLMFHHFCKKMPIS